MQQGKAAVLGNTAPPWTPNPPAGVHAHPAQGTRHANPPPQRPTPHPGLTRQSQRIQSGWVRPMRVEGAAGCWFRGPGHAPKGQCGSTRPGRLLQCVDRRLCIEYPALHLPLGSAANRLPFEPLEAMRGADCPSRSSGSILVRSSPSANPGPGSRRLARKQEGTPGLRQEDSHGDSCCQDPEAVQQGVLHAACLCGADDTCKRRGEGGGVWW